MGATRLGTPFRLTSFDTVKTCYFNYILYFILIADQHQNTAILACTLPSPYRLYCAPSSSPSHCFEPFNQLTVCAHLSILPFSFKYCNGVLTLQLTLQIRYRSLVEEYYLRAQGTWTTLTAQNKERKKSNLGRSNRPKTPLPTPVEPSL